MENIDKYTTLLNTLRLKGGIYKTSELVKELKGLPNYYAIPTIMKRHKNISGYIITDDGIQFDSKHSIYKEAVIKLIEEARKYASECSHKSYIKRQRTEFINMLKNHFNKPIKTTKIALDKAVNQLCIDLYWQGRSSEVPDILRQYNLYVKKC